MIAYRILGLSLVNENETIRKAYLKSLAKYPPEKFPQQYQIVRKAYELIQTEQKRLEYYLFGYDDDISFEEYSSICLNVEKSITADKWNTLCQLYQKNKLKQK